MNFIELVESQLAEQEDLIEESLLEDIDSLLDDGMTLSEIAQHVAMDESEVEEIYEDIKKHVTAAGDVTKKRDKAFRSRRATLTTGMSKAQLKKRARKATKTKVRSAGTMRKALKKRAKAMKRRKQMGIK